MIRALLRRKIASALALLTLAVAADTLLWVAAEARLESIYESLQGHTIDGGWRISGGQALKVGWPFRALLIVPHPAIEGGDGVLPGGLAWQAERLVFGVSLLHPATLRVAPEGAEQLRVSHAPALVFSATRLDAWVPFGSGRPAYADLRASGLAGGLAQSAHQQDVHADTLALHLDIQEGHDIAPTRVGFAFALEGLDLPDTRRWPLGARIAAASVRGELISPPVSGSVPAAQARAWRDGGGKLALQDVDLHWGPLGAQGEASLALDQALQPVGRGRAKLTGYEASLDALAGGGAITPGLATTAKAVLGLLALQQLTAVSGAIDLPFTLKDNTLSIGKIPLVHLAGMVWRDK